MEKIFVLIFFLSFCLLKPLSAIALQPLDLIINEIAWMGTEKSYNDEWLELYNNSSLELDLAGWKIKSENSKFNIELVGKIAPKGFFILERTDDQSLPEVSADLIYKGALNNSGEHIKLTDNENQIIDEINCENGWFAGNNETKQTMERKSPLGPGSDNNNWLSSGNPGGTPKKESSMGANEVKSKTNDENGRVMDKEIQSFASSAFSFSSPSQIYINELLPSPDGPDKGNEWIEIFNGGDALNLSGWQITDVLGKTQVYSFPQETIIKNNGFLVLPDSLTKITLNNDGDSVLLINPAGETIDNISFKKSPQGKSYSRINNEWTWNSLPTPGKQNILPDSKNNSHNTSSSIDYQKIEKLTNPIKTKGMASIYQTIPKFNFSFILLVAFSLSFLSGMFFILFKKRFSV
ncbi:MAG: lamin tail domain-containing protein [Candidatus Nealsonbacteria bacterium]|nr:lamin tail domain-containing protein [Candidatus Nealsonbacteria bacterium]